jgi:hypothetical protein
MASNSEHLIDIDRDTGEYVQGWGRIKQSIYVILTTRLLTRLMRLWWGSDYLDMQDKPGNADTFTRGIMAAMSAVNTYEPEFKITSVVIEELTAEGRVLMTVNGVDLIEQKARRVQVPL